jgi:predicted PurR-regulated permease PerM
MPEEKILDISWGTILKISITFLGFYILYLIKDILIWAIFALIISILFDPAIDFLQRRKFSRLLATLFIYIVFFGAFALLIYLIAPAFVSEIQQFTQLFPQYFEKLAPPLRGLGFEAFESFEVFTKKVQDWFVGASASIFNALFSFFGGVFSTISIFTLAVFLSLEEKGVERTIALIFPDTRKDYVLNLWERSKRKVAGWFGARVLSSIFVGSTTFLACSLFNIKYALSFAFLAGILDIIPIVGPAVAGAIIVIFSALDAWLKAIFVLIVFVLIQQIEGNIITPLLAKKFIGLPPVLVLIALMAGGELGGVLGAVLSIPLTGIIYGFLRDFLKKKKTIEKLET